MRASPRSASHVAPRTRFARRNDANALEDLQDDDPAGWLDVCHPADIDPKAAFGKVRAPVRVTLNGYTFRSTIAAMGGPCFIPFRRSHREAAGLEGGETLQVRVDLDTEKREVKPPPDLVKALKAAPAALERWRALSYTHQREHVEAIEEAKKPETRAGDRRGGRHARDNNPSGGPPNNRPPGTPETPPPRTLPPPSRPPRPPALW